MKRLDTRDPGFDSALDELLATRGASAARVDGPVASILQDVRARATPPCARPPHALIA